MRKQNVPNRMVASITLTQSTVSLLIKFRFLFWIPDILILSHCTSETSDYSTLVPHVKTVPLLDWRLLLMILVGMLTCSRPGTFSGIICLNCITKLSLESDCIN
jgi:hypothetical protein